MRKLLIGPVLTGIGWVAGSHYGARADQLVHKSPDAVYAGMNDALASIPDHGMTSMEGGTPVPYELRFDRLPGRQLTLHVLFDGHEGGQTIIDFQPQGADTLMIARAHGDRDVLRSALAGTSKARLAYAPDWMLNLLAIKPLLKQLGQQIEAGHPPQLSGMTQADWESSLSPDEQKRMQQYRQSAAAQPTLDPNAAARQFMGGASR